MPLPAFLATNVRERGRLRCRPPGAIADRGPNNERNCRRVCGRCSGVLTRVDVAGRPLGARISRPARARLTGPIERTFGRDSASDHAVNQTRAASPGGRRRISHLTRARPSESASSRLFPSSRRARALTIPRVFPLETGAQVCERVCECGGWGEERGCSPLRSAGITSYKTGGREIP